MGNSLLDQRSQCLGGVNGSCCDNRPGNPPGKAFLTEITQDFGEGFFTQAVDQVCSRSTCSLIKAHIKGTFLHKRKAPPWSIDLHRGYTQIEQDAMYVWPTDIL